jgi:hypothetical protein
MGVLKEGSAWRGCVRVDVGSFWMCLSLGVRCACVGGVDAGGGGGVWVCVPGDV